MYIMCSWRRGNFVWWK